MRCHWTLAGLFCFLAATPAAARGGKPSVARAFLPARVAVPLRPPRPPQRVIPRPTASAEWRPRPSATADGTDRAGNGVSTGGGSLRRCCLLAEPSAAQDAAAIWEGVAQPAFDPAKSAAVENLTLVRDRIRITLARGAIQFALPVAGQEFAAAFQGRGRLTIVPPSAREAQQLRLFTGQPSLDLAFSEATFSFHDSTYDEVSRQVRWAPATPRSDLTDLYRSRQRRREDYGAAVLPRLFQAVLSAGSGNDSYFLADLKTDRFGWVQVRYDGGDLEEVEIGRWRGSPAGVELFDTWMHFPANDRSPMTLDEHPLAKDDYLVRGYDIDTTVTAGAELSATSTLSLALRQAGERVLLFHLNANLRVSGVEDAGGRSLAFFQPRAYGDGPQQFGDYVAVVLPQPTTAGGAAALKFHYAGRKFIRKAGAGEFFCPSFGWYPAPADEFATRAHFALTFHSPRKFILTATGERTGSKREGKEIVTTWRSPKPFSVAGFAFGAYKELDRRVGPATTVQVLANVNPNDMLSTIQAMAGGDLPGTSPLGAPPLGLLSPSRMADTVGGQVSNALLLFENYFGPYPYPKLTVTNIPYSYGQGWPTLLYLSFFTFLDATQRHVLGLPDTYQAGSYFRGHETSHQWWGHLVGWKTYHDQWLSEGFADFSGNLYVGVQEGSQEYLNQFKREREKLLAKNQYGHVYDSLGPVWMGERLGSSEAPDGYSTVIYDKGGWILHMLRMMLFDGAARDPDAAFKAMMHDFTATYANQAASTEDFEAIVNKHMTPTMDLDRTHTMDWFFRQYVYGTGIPDYTFSYQISPAPGGRWKVAGTLTRSGVPSDWEDIVPLYLHKGKQMLRYGWITARQPTTAFSFVLPEKPDRITVDDYQDLLATFHQ